MKKINFISLVPLGLLSPISFMVSCSKEKNNSEPDNTDNELNKEKNKILAEFELLLDIELVTKNKFKKEIEDAKTLKKIKEIYEQAKTLNEMNIKIKQELQEMQHKVLHQIKFLAFLSLEEKKKFETNIQNAKNIKEVELIQQEANVLNKKKKEKSNLITCRIEIINQIKSLKDIDKTTKTQFETFINQATTIDEIETFFKRAQELNIFNQEIRESINKIELLQLVQSSEKEVFKNQIKKSKNIAEIKLILKQAQDLEQTRKQLEDNLRKIKIQAINQIFILNSLNQNQKKVFEKQINDAKEEAEIVQIIESAKRLNQENKDKLNNNPQSDYELEKNKIYPNDRDYDANPETTEKKNEEGLDWKNVENYDDNNVFFNENQQKKIVLKTRTSKIGDHKAEIAELKSLFTKLVESNEYYAFNVESLNFNARNMTKAMLEWLQESWIDYLYLGFSLRPIYFKTETADGDQVISNPNSKTFQDQFIRLKSIEKVPTSIKLNWINEGKEKQNFLNFLKNGLAQINEGMSDLDKVYAISRYVCDYIVYSDEAAYHDLEYTINTKKGVCQQYGTSIALLLQLVGVQAVPKPSGDLSHQYAFAYFDPTGGSNKSWHRVDGSFIDDGRKENEPIKDIFIYKKGRNYQNIMAPPIVGNSKSIYSGYDLLKFLPWDFMFKNNEIAQDNNFNNTFLYLTQNSTTEKLCRYFFSNGYWYMITNKKLGAIKNVNYLYRVKSNSNKYEVVKIGDKILIPDDKIANLINLDGFFHRTYDHNGLLYLFHKKDSEVVVDVIDLVNTTMISQNIKLLELTNSLDMDKIVTIENIKMDILKNTISFKALGKKHNQVIEQEAYINLTDKQINNKLHYVTKTVHTKNDLWRQLILTRATLGTYMFSHKPKLYSLNIILRDEFKLLEKEIKNKLSNLSLLEIEHYWQKLENLLNKIDANRWIMPVKNSLKIDQQLPKEMYINTSYFNDFGFILPFNAIYDFTYANTSSQHICYDVYYSNTKLDENNLDNSKLILKNVLKSELKINKNLISFNNNREGYVLIKAYYRGHEKNKKHAIFSNQTKLNFYESNDKYSIFLSLPANKLNNYHNLYSSPTATDFASNYNIDFSFVINNYQNIKNPINCRIIYKNFNERKIVKEKTIIPSEINKITYIVDKNNNSFGGSYTLEIDIEFQGKTITYYSNHFLDLTQSDLNNFDINKYF